MKKLIAWILTLCALFSLVPATYADDGTKVQAGNEEADLLQIQVNFAGYLHTAAVLRAEDGTLLAPLEWMTFYGCLERESLMGIRLYNKDGQEELRNYAKRWIILPQTGHYYVNWYFDTQMFVNFVANSDDYSFWDAQKLKMQPEPVQQELLDNYFSQKNTAVKRIGTNYMPIHQGQFSKILTYDNDYWVPMSELLSLLEVSAGVTKDGRILCVEPSEMTLFDVLYEYGDSIEDMLFDSEDVVGNDFMAGVGWFTATCTGELYNLVPSRGREIDYKEIFTSYLQDNEVYLSAFNVKNDPNVSYFRKVSETFKDAKTVCQSGVESLDPLYQILLKDATDPDFYKKFFDPAEELCLAIDVAANMMTYIEAFANQVEDHRLMLDAVYKHSADKKWPSYVASQAISKMYASEADLAVNGTIDLTRKMLMEELSNEAYKKLYGGWYYAIEITKVICKDDYEYVVNSSKINLVSNTVQYAYEIFEDRFYDREFNEKGMNNIRLCLMMSLVGTRHAFKTYWQDSRNDDVEAIDKILTKLYQVGTNRKENNINTCKDRLKQYKEDFAKLQPRKNDPVVLAEQGILLNVIGNDNWEGGWRVNDLDQDLQEEVSVMRDDGSGLIRVDLDIDSNDINYSAGSVTDILAYQSEFIPQQEQVFGNVQEHFAALDSHFERRDGVVYILKQDLNGDGTEDRLYAILDATRYWDYDDGGTLCFPSGNLSIVVAEAKNEGAMLRYYFDPKVHFNRSNIVSNYADGELQINGHAYKYKEKGSVPFEKIGIVTLQSLYSYLIGEVMPWEQARVEISYPEADDHRKMDLLIDGTELSVFAEMVGKKPQIYEIQIESWEKPISIMGDLTTENTAREIIELLTVADWDSHQIVPFLDNLSVVSGPTLVTDGSGPAYECSVLWAVAEDDIYQLTMKLHEESLDSKPYGLMITSLKNPIVPIYELFLKTPEQMAQLLTGYTDNASEGEAVIYGDGWNGDAKVDIRYEPMEGEFRAVIVDVEFGDCTITIFPGLDSKAKAEDAENFLQPKMDWDLDHSDFTTEVYYHTNFVVDEEYTDAFWWTTMRRKYPWTPEDGYGDAYLVGIKFMYSCPKDDPSMSAYWTLYG